MRRRLFGLSHDSAVSVMNSSGHSKNSPLSSSTVRDTEGKDNDNFKEKGINGDQNLAVDLRHVRSKKSVDAKASDRLSIFATFGGKNRKPPPQFVSLNVCFFCVLSHFGFLLH